MTTQPTSKTTTLPYKLEISIPGNLLIFSPKSSNIRATTNICPPHLLTPNEHAYKHYPIYINNQHFLSLARSKHPQNILCIFFSSVAGVLVLSGYTRKRLSDDTEFSHSKLKYSLAQNWIDVTFLTNCSLSVGLVYFVSSNLHFINILLAFSHKTGKSIPMILLKYLKHLIFLILQSLWDLNGIYIVGIYNCYILNISITRATAFIITTQIKDFVQSNERCT